MKRNFLLKQNNGSNEKEDITYLPKTCVDW